MVSSEHPPALAKSVWTDADYAEMGWHDNAIHALAFEPTPTHPGRLMVDLDYIVRWDAPERTGAPFTFWSSPATLVFDPAWDLTTDINFEGWAFRLELAEIVREPSDRVGNFSWTLSGHNCFSIRLMATGFTQYLRRPPVHSDHQRLELDRRGGISFEEKGYVV